jgi:hypothetical protein
LGTLFKAALFHELYARERFQIFFPAMSGQAMKFAAEKRAEMRRAAFQAGADVLSSGGLFFWQSWQGKHNE